MRTLFGLFLLFLTVIAVDGTLHEYFQRLQPSSVDAGAVRSCFSSTDLCAGAIEESTVHQPVVLTAAASGLIVDDDHHPQPGIAFRNTHCAAPCACPPKPCWVTVGYTTDNCAISCCDLVLLRCPVQVTVRVTGWARTSAHIQALYQLISALCTLVSFEIVWSCD